MRKGPTLQATYFGLAFAAKRPDLSNGRLHLPYSEGGIFRFEPPRTSSDCRAVTSGGRFGWAAFGSQGNHHEVPRELRPCFGSTVETGFGGFG